MIAEQLALDVDEQRVLPPDRTDPNRHVPPHPRSRYCTDRCKHDAPVPA